MAFKNRNPAFISMMALGKEMAQAAREYNLRKTTVNGLAYKVEDTEQTSHRIKQPIIVSATGLVSMCTRAEWYLVGFIMQELYEYNALWMADKLRKNNSPEYRTAIKGLVTKNVLILTESPHIYIVNPMYMRRGDPFAVAATTANMLLNRKPTPEMLMDKRPVTSIDFNQSYLEY